MARIHHHHSYHNASSYYTYRPFSRLTLVLGGLFILLLGLCVWAAFGALPMLGWLKVQYTAIILIMVICIVPIDVGLFIIISGLLLRNVPTYGVARGKQGAAVINGHPGAAGQIIKYVLFFFHWGIRIIIAVLDLALLLYLAGQARSLLEKYSQAKPPLPTIWLAAFIAAIVLSFALMLLWCRWTNKAQFTGEVGQMDL